MVKKNAYDRIWEKASGLYLSHRKLMDILFVALLFVILFFVRVNNINVKNQLHSDEVFSLMLSTCNNYYNQSIPDGDYTGADLKRMITADNEGGIDGAFSDIAQLWHNNGDAPHASLYYMVLRFALIGFDSFDVHSLSWRGGALNLVFFAISFLLMYKLLRRLFGDNILLVLAGLAIAFGNWMSIRNTMLIREYQMAESGIIMLTLIGVVLVQTIRANGIVSYGIRDFFGIFQRCLCLAFWSRHNVVMLQEQAERCNMDFIVVRNCRCRDCMDYLSGIL